MGSRQVYIAGELRAGTGCMQCGELGSGFTTGIYCR